MNQIVTVNEAAAAPVQRLSIIQAMASNYNMEADTFLATMRATVFTPNMKREEEAAFLLVAKHHNLNPVTREIYAMPKKGGGIIPVVSIDGWVRMSNENPAFDGMEFEFEHDADKNLISTTCRIYRKDRSHPISVTEYLSECKRETEPWKMQHRMLRHKAMIQCARYAFGFSGIYDQDEAERFAAEQPQRRVAPSPSAPMIEHSPEPSPAQEAPQAAQGRRKAPSPTAAAQPKPEAIHYDPEATRKRWLETSKAAADENALNEAWEQVVGPIEDQISEPDKHDLIAIYNLRLGELGEGGDP